MILQSCYSRCFQLILEHGFRSVVGLCHLLISCDRISLHGLRGLCLSYVPYYNMLWSHSIIIHFSGIEVITYIIIMYNNNFHNEVLTRCLVAIGNGSFTEVCVLYIAIAEQYVLIAAYEYGIM